MNSLANLTSRAASVPETVRNRLTAKNGLVILLLGPLLLFACWAFTGILFREFPRLRVYLLWDLIPHSGGGSAAGPFVALRVLYPVALVASLVGAVKVAKQQAGHGKDKSGHAIVFLSVLVTTFIPGFLFSAGLVQAANSGLNWLLGLIISPRKFPTLFSITSFLVVFIGLASHWLTRGIRGPRIVDQVVEEGKDLSAYERASQKAATLLAKVKHDKRASRKATAFLAKIKRYFGWNTLPSSVATDHFAKVKHDLGLYFGWNTLPSSVATDHFAMIGSPKSGKTVALLYLMRFALWQMQIGKRVRAVVYDGKTELIPYVMAVNPAPDRCQVYIMNPLDARSVAWDIAADITRPEDAEQLARILIADGGGKDSGDQYFWHSFARNVVAAIIRVFQHIAPGKWTLRDVILCVYDNMFTRLVPILKLDPDPRNRGTLSYLEDPEMRKLALSMHATLDQQLRRLTTVAALWEHCERSISLREDWVGVEAILVLGTSPTSDVITRVLNQIILERLFELVLKKGPTDERSWFFLDELREAPKLDKLPRFLTQARAMGGCVVSTFQDYPGFKHVYGDHEAQEIAGLSMNMMFFRSDDPATDEWACKQFGKIRYGVTTESVTQSQQESSTQSYHSVERDVLLKGTLMSIPPTEPGGQFVSYNKVPILQECAMYRAELPFEAVIEQMPKPAEGVPAFVPRPPEQSVLTDWTVDDLKRLNLEGVITLGEPAALPSTEGTADFPEFGILGN